MPKYWFSKHRKNEWILVRLGKILYMVTVTVTVETRTTTAGSERNIGVESTIDLHA